MATIVNTHISKCIEDFQLMVNGCQIIRVVWRGTHQTRVVLRFKRDGGYSNQISGGMISKCPHFKRDNFKICPFKRDKNNQWQPCILYAPKICHSDQQKEVKKINIYWEWDKKYRFLFTAPILIKVMLIVKHDQISITWRTSNNTYMPEIYRKKYVIH